MPRNYWQVAALATLLALMSHSVIRADDPKPSYDGKATEFKGMTFNMKVQGEVVVLLHCLAGKQVTVTTKGVKQTDVDLYIYDVNRREIAKDTSPGPKCELKFTPTHDEKVKVLVHNWGPGSNRVTLEAKVAK